MSDAPSLPTRGWLEGRTHVFPVRVYYEDTDAGGLVFHANYLRYVERARTEMMRLLGISHTELLAGTGVVFAVRRLGMEFRTPARLDDTLEVRTRVVDIRGASMEVEQIVLQSGTEPRVVAKVRVTLFVVDDRIRPARIPQTLRAALDAVHDPGADPSPAPSPAIGAHLRD